MPSAEVEFDSVALLSAVAPTTAAAGLARRSASVLRRWWLRLGLLVVLCGLLYFALRNVPIREVWHALAALQVWQIGLLLSLDALIFALVSARWWFVVRAELRAVRFLPMFAVRLSVFAISYFTLGPQIGGEPLQVLYLRRNHGISYTRATASVVMDKLFELLGNLVLLSFGLLAVFRSGLLAGTRFGSPLGILLLGLLISWPLVHIVLLHFHVYPVAALLGALGLLGSHNKPARFIRAAEHLAGRFCQRHPGNVLGSLVVSLLAAGASVSEYALIASFLHIGLPFWQLVTAWTTGWLSFLVPLPGGLGALEASQVWTLGAFGIPAATAIGVALIVRGRDLLIGGVGLLLAGNIARMA